MNYEDEYKGLLESVDEVVKFMNSSSNDKTAAMMPKFSTTLRAEVEELRTEIFNKGDSNTPGGGQNKNTKANNPPNTPGYNPTKSIKPTTAAQPKQSNTNHGSRARGSVQPGITQQAPSPVVGATRPSKLEELRLNKKASQPATSNNPPNFTLTLPEQTTSPLRAELGVVDITMTDHPAIRTVHPGIGGGSDHYFEEFGANGMVVVNEAQVGNS